MERSCVIEGGHNHKVALCRDPPEAEARANSPDQRRLTELGFGNAVVDNVSTNADAIRGREQMLIDHYGGAQSVGGTSANRIQGIGNFNAFGQDYINNAIREFGTLSDRSPDRFRLWSAPR